MDLIAIHYLKYGEGERDNLRRVNRRAKVAAERAAAARRCRRVERLLAHELELGV